ncbi:MAG: tetratricopeptide repeat protein [Nitrospirae bacterium]|nr:tetratricopeptide repeat protein [Nitrospirota bacterium]
MQEAIREYKTALNINPWFVDAHNNLGDVYFNKGQVEDAIIEYNLNPAIELQSTEETL